MIRSPLACLDVLENLQFVGKLTISAFFVNDERKRHGIYVQAFHIQAAKSQMISSKARQRYI